MRRLRATLSPWTLAALLLCAALALGACASGGGGGGGESGGGETTEPAKQAVPRGVAPPTGHRMAGVQLNMSPREVEKIMGDPTSDNSYITGKAFIPWYFGSDSGRRVDYKYKGEGRVVFGVHRWNGRLRVVRIDYDPNEDGQ
ncbi:MAG: hypothetical protein AAF430_04055 [Myxococcota bacterium]